MKGIIPQGSKLDQQKKSLKPSRVRQHCCAVGLSAVARAIYSSLRARPTTAPETLRALLEQICHGVGQEKSPLTKKPIGRSWRGDFIPKVDSINPPKLPLITAVFLNSLFHSTFNNLFKINQLLI
jgi:hypothetical protein